MLGGPSLWLGINMGPFAVKLRTVKTKPKKKCLFDKFLNGQFSVDWLWPQWHEYVTKIEFFWLDLPQLSTLTKSHQHSSKNIYSHEHILKKHLFGMKKNPVNLSGLREWVKGRCCVRGSRQDQFLCPVDGCPVKWEIPVCLKWVADDCPECGRRNKTGASCHLGSETQWM